MTRRLIHQPIDYNDEAWMARSLCRELKIDTDWFYADLDTKRYDHDREVMAICAECPVRIACLDYAIRENEPGIWGGTYEDQRSKIRAVRRGLFGDMLLDLGPEITSVAKRLVDG